MFRPSADFQATAQNDNKELPLCNLRDMYGKYHNLAAHASVTLMDDGRWIACLPHVDVNVHEEDDCVRIVPQFSGETVNDALAKLDRRLRLEKNVFFNYDPSFSPRKRIELIVG